ncbi:serine/threonine-protein kinase [Arthrobacter sp. CG_A4]|uniref:serine/threonine-protein kinase n=1 Tax=Arthrobacter sp. CG_A4 TaxID=3071706 RepID=UPI002DFA28A5|nr:serine/threonine protein kinase [Arthrobacter sp. CG_A4]
MEDDARTGDRAPEVPGYDVGRCLGRGGSATVWLVTEQSTGRAYALKCFPCRSANDGEATEARDPEEGMRREVRILSALAHEHLVKARSVVRIRSPRGGAPSGDGDGGTPFADDDGGGASSDGGDGAGGDGDSGDGLGLVLDYAPGGSLGGLVAGRGKLGAGETVTILTPLAQALAYLHGNGFTHGDLSPGNVLFTAHGKPLLADLGVARMVADPGDVSQAGTDGFRDPAPVDAVRAGLQPERDVYSLAALGWYCLTGRAPEPGPQRPPLPLLVPDVPAALAAALEAGMHEDRRQRPPAAEFAAAIYRSAEAAPVDLSVSVHATVIPELLTRRALPRSARERRAARRRGWLGRTWRRRRRLPGSRSPRNRLRRNWHRRNRLPRNGLPPGTATQTTPGPAAQTTPVTQTAPGSGPGSRRPGAAPAGAHRRLPGTQQVARPRRVRAVARRQAAGALLAVSLLAVALLGVALLGGAWLLAGGRVTLAPFPELVPPPGAATEAATEAPPGAATEAATTPDPSGAAPPAGPQAGAPAEAEVRADLDALLASVDPEEAVRGLARLRSLAFSSGNFRLLDQVNVPGSAAAGADGRISALLTESGHVLAGFATVLTRVEGAAGGTATRAVVAVSAATTPYREQDSAGKVVADAAATPEQRLQLVLVPVDGRWRIQEILPEESAAG